MCDINIVVILFIIVIVGVFVFSYNRQENFGQNGIEIMRLGNVRYDLKGQELHTRRLNDCYYDKRICYDNTFGNTEENTGPNYRTMTS